MTNAVTASSTYVVPFAEIIPGGPWLSPPGSNFGKPFKYVPKIPGFSSAGQDILFIDGTFEIGITPPST